MGSLPPTLYRTRTHDRTRACAHTTVVVVCLIWYLFVDGLKREGRAALELSEGLELAYLLLHGGLAGAGEWVPHVVVEESVQDEEHQEHCY